MAIESMMAGILPWIKQFVQIIIVVFFGAIFIAIIGFGTYFYMLNKAYSKYRVIVWRRFKDEQGKTTGWSIVDCNEKARQIYDKKLKRRYYHLKNANCHLGEEETENKDENRDLDLPCVPYEKGGMCVFVEQLGPKKFAVGKPLSVNGEAQIIISEADCAEATRSYLLLTSTFENKNKDFWAFTLYIILGVLAMILIYLILNKFELLNQVADKLVAATESFSASKSSIVASTAPG